MRQKRSTLTDVGIGLVVLGLVVQVALFLTVILGGLIGKLATGAIIVGIIIAIIGAVTQDRRY